jgi:hypothetical protein
MKYFKIIISVVVIVFCVILFTQQQQFPPKDNECFTRFAEEKQRFDSGTANTDSVFPSFELSHVTEFRCASQIAFDQYEVRGIDTAGHAFYVHNSAGGMAASGGDGHYDYCYNSDNVMIASDRYIGRNGPHQPSVCTWEEGFPDAPRSTYSYHINKKR